jgi:hypothetical protein
MGINGKQLNFRYFAGMVAGSTDFRSVLLLPRFPSSYKPGPLETQPARGCSAFRPVQEFLANFVSS